MIWYCLIDYEYVKELVTTTNLGLQMYDKLVILSLFLFPARKRAEEREKDVAKLGFNQIGVPKKSPN